MSSFIQTEIVQGKYGQFGYILLNRPDALNALNGEMILALKTTLSQWEADPSILAVIVRSTSEKAFCAGGDIRAVYETGRSKTAEVLHFFKQEYHLNSYIYHYPKPYITFLNGITMGGGVGISLHGSHPVAGENFRFAMPETTIGFFPDIGGSYLLNRCPGMYGRYLGLTGARLARKEAYALGLIKYAVDVGKQMEMMNALHQLDLRENAKEKVSNLFLSYHTPIETDALFEETTSIHTAFSGDFVEEILDKLLENGEKKIHDDLIRKSPTSLKVSLELLKRTRAYSLDECLALDGILVSHFLQEKDFYEGVRALIIDKDNSPHWHPASLQEVDAAMVNRYFCE